MNPSSAPDTQYFIWATIKTHFFSALEFTKSTAASPRFAPLVSSHVSLWYRLLSDSSGEALSSSSSPPKKKTTYPHASLIIDTSNGLQLTSPGAQSSPWFLPQSAPGWVTLVLNELPLWHSLKKDYVVLIATYNMQGICHLNESINGMNVQ